MTVDREQMAAELKQGLQAEIDHLGLGLRIVFVGLKDVHPPVDVAAAYERVTSAQQTKESTVDLARAYEARILPGAQAEAQRLVVEADAAATRRVDQATGEAARFTALATAEHDEPGLFRIRLRYDALDEGLGAVAKTLVGLSGAVSPGTYLDLRGRGDAIVPGADHPRQASPTVRATAQELPDH